MASARKSAKIDLALYTNGITYKPKRANLSDPANKYRTKKEAMEAIDTFIGLHAAITNTEALQYRVDQEMKALKSDFNSIGFMLANSGIEVDKIIEGHSVAAKPALTFDIKRFAEEQPELFRELYDIRLRQLMDLDEPDTSLVTTDFILDIIENPKPSPKQKELQMRIRETIPIKIHSETVKVTKKKGAE